MRNASVIFVAALAFTGLGYFACLVRMACVYNAYQRERQARAEAEASYEALRIHTDDLRLRLGVKRAQEKIQEQRFVSTREDGLPDA